VSGGKKPRNMALDEYVEILNREIKNATSRFQTKESAEKFERLSIFDKVFIIDEICDVRGRKGFHHIHSYCEDVKIVLNDLIFTRLLAKILDDYSVVKDFTKVRIHLL
jgi:hypothetical protein